jgi:hypothetical protein
VSAVCKASPIITAAAASFLSFRSKSRSRWHQSGEIYRSRAKEVRAADCKRIPPLLSNRSFVALRWKKKRIEMTDAICCEQKPARTICVFAPQQMDADEANSDAQKMKPCGDVSTLEFCYSVVIRYLSFAPRVSLVLFCDPSSSEDFQIRKRRRMRATMPVFFLFSLR